MCFYIHKDHPHPKTADQDIPCFKILLVKRSILLLPRLNQLTSPSMDEPYKLGTTMESEIEVSTIEVSTENLWYGTSDGTTIDVGLHSFSTLDAAQTLHHRAACLNPYSILRVYRIFESTIPKGSRYYHNPSMQEYVSDKLTVYKQL